MSKKYCGVLTRAYGEYILLTNGEDINLTNVLTELYEGYETVHMTIKNDMRELLNQTSDLYKDETSDFEYEFHINGLNIEQILNDNLNGLIDVTIDVLEDSEEVTDEQSYTVCRS